MFSHLEKHKWTAAFISGLLFIILSSPIAYKGTDYLGSFLKQRTVDWSGRPSYLGLALHGVVFAAITRGLMAWKCMDGKLGYSPSQNQNYHAIARGLIFALLSSTYAYQTTSKTITPLVASNAERLPLDSPARIASPLGSATPTGLILHALVFTIVIRFTLDYDATTEGFNPFKKASWVKKRK